MNPSTSRRWLHRFAWLTATLTLLLPVTTGAVVTTLKAGMAFGDWPSSDGYNMLAYPWLCSARDQFVEHGHRLSGLMIGLLSVALAVFAWCVNCGRTAKWLATAIFASVFAQGMLGGARVLLDRETLALVHGDFAAGVFSLMSVFVLVTADGWEARDKHHIAGTEPPVFRLAMLTLALMAIQYFFGGVLRHLKLGWAWWIHPWFALAPLISAVVLLMAARKRGAVLFARLTKILAGLVVSQALLGLATWYVRYGVPSWGVVAAHESLPQVVVCSLHKIIGMLTLMTSVLAVVESGNVFIQAPFKRAGEPVEINHAAMGVAT